MKRQKSIIVTKKQSGQQATSVADLLRTTVLDITGTNTKTVDANSPVIVTNRSAAHPEWGPHVPVLVELSSSGGGGDEIALLTRIADSNDQVVTKLDGIATRLDGISIILADVVLELRKVSTNTSVTAGNTNDTSVSTSQAVPLLQQIVANTADQDSDLGQLVNNTNRTANALERSAAGTAPLWTNRDLVKVSLWEPSGLTSQIPLAPPIVAVNPLFVQPTGPDGAPGQYPKLAAMGTSNVWEVGVDNRKVVSPGTSIMRCGPAQIQPLPPLTDSTVPTPVFDVLRPIRGSKNAMYNDTNNRLPLYTHNLAIAAGGEDSDEDSFDVCPSPDDVKSGAYQKL